MPFVAGGENFLDGHINTFPCCTPGLETLNCRLTGSAILIFSRYQMGNRFAVARDRDCFTALHCAQELCEMGLGFRCLNFTHFI